MKKFLRKTKVISRLLIILIVIMSIVCGKPVTETEASTETPIEISEEEKSKEETTEELCPEEPEIPLEPSMPGRIEGTGTYFEIKDSEYLNIILKSTKEIKVVLESMPRMISLDIETALEEISSAVLTLEGLEPNKTYYKYQESYKNEAVFVTDEKGNCSWSQDLTQPHHIWIQEIRGTILIPDQCSDCGTWDEETSTCTLTQDLTESVEIIADNITLDGNGHSINGEGTGSGIYLYEKKNVTIKNCVISNFYYGVILYSYYAAHRSSYNILDNNTLKSNNYGIYLSHSANNKLLNNHISNNNLNGIKLRASSDNTINGNTVNSSKCGINLGEGFDPHANPIPSKNNIIINNTINSNQWSGIFLNDSSNNTITNNAILNNGYGIRLDGSPNNNLAENIVSLNNEGISFLHSTDNTLTNNTVNSNKGGGIFFSHSSSNNTLRNNTISENQYNLGFYWNDAPEAFVQDIDISNTINGKPIYYLVNEEDKEISGEAGFIGLVNSSGITVKNLTLNNNWYGVLLVSTENSKIENIHASNNYHGIYILNSSNNNFINNNVSNNESALHLRSSSNNIFNGNTVRSNNSCAIYLYYALDNIFYHNNFIDNLLTYPSCFLSQVYNITPQIKNIFDNGYPVGGNYWSDYTGVDEKNGFNQDQAGSDGIGDSPYGIYYYHYLTSTTEKINQDNYPFMVESGWEALALPDLSITSTPLEFFNDEPPFLPNVLKIKATVTNEGNAEAENVIVKFTLNGELLGEKFLGSLKSSDTTTTDVRWEAISNVENATITAKAIAVSQGEHDLSDNTITQPVSFYWVDHRYDPPGFRHDRDAFSFPNPHFKHWYEYFTEIAAVIKEAKVAHKVAALIGGWFFQLSSIGGHCYGMASASTIWYMDPGEKPIDIPTYAMSYEQEEVKAEIVVYHWRGILSILPGLTERLLSYNAQTQYELILQDIKANEPAVLAMWNLSEGEAHAISAYKILDLGKEKQVYVYDNEIPLEWPKPADYYVIFKPSSNEGSYDSFDKVLYVPKKLFVVPLEYSDIQELVKEANKELWNNSIALFWIHSPVTPLLTDEFGRRIGYVDNTFINEIPDAKLVGQLDSYLFYLPSNLSYSIEMTGTDTGELGLDFVIPINESRAKVITYKGIPVTLGSKATTTFNAMEVPREVTLDTGEIVEPESIGEVDDSDIVPPAPINDLTATNPRTDCITLSWTAPGDDWDKGTATAYDIRYSTSPITEHNWDLAIQVIDEPVPQPAGSKETFVVNGLDWDTTYYFAIKTADEIPNWSRLSNIASGTTRIKATVDIDPDTLNLNSRDKRITAYIELPIKYDVSQIDISSVKLNNIVIAESNPKYGFVKKPEIKDRDGNGLPELMVKFSREEVQEILELGEEIIVIITGKVSHKEQYKEFEGSDIIKVIDKKGR